MGRVSERALYYCVAVLQQGFLKSEHCARLGSYLDLDFEVSGRVVGPTSDHWLWLHVLPLPEML